MMAAMMPQLHSSPMAALLLQQQRRRAQQQAAKPMAAPAPAPAAPGMFGGKGLFGMDGMTLLKLASAFGANSGQPLAAALPGVTEALQDQQVRQEQEQQSEAQKRALAMMQMGDMKGAIAVLGSAKGLEADAFNMGARVYERDDERRTRRQDDYRTYRRDRRDYVSDRDEGRVYEEDRYKVERGDQVSDREDQQRHDEHITGLRASATEKPGWDKITDKDGKVWWVEPGTSNKVDSGIDAPGANARSLLGAEAYARAVAGIPGAKEANARMEQMRAEGYSPGKDWGARVVDAVPFVGNQVAAWAGGKDFQSYKQAFAQFEAAMMPILSGAAVSDSEAKRQILATRPELEDDPATLDYKDAQRKRMVDAVALAMEGDRTALNAMIAERNTHAGGGAPTQDDEDLPRITTAEQRAQLTPGTWYLAPDGSRRRVPVQR